MSEEEDKKAAEFILEMVDKKGIAISSVSDGHVIMVKRSFLEELLAKDPTKEQFLIFLKRPEFKN